MTTLQFILLLSAALFATGLAIVLARRNAILVLVGVEFMLGAGSLNFVAFWRFGGHADPLAGMMFALFALAVAAGGAAVGLALVLLVHRHFKTVNLGGLSGDPGKGAKP